MQNSNTKQFEIFNASEYKVGIVRACFNDDITSEMLKSALTALAEYQVVKENIIVHEVPGCVEIPAVLKAMASTYSYDALIVLGAVIKGETPHFDYVCKMVSEGVLHVSLQNIIPVGFGIATVNSYEQAKARTRLGRDAVVAAIESAKIIKSEEVLMDYTEDE